MSTLSRSETSPAPPSRKRRRPYRAWRVDSQISVPRQTLYNWKKKRNVEDINDIEGYRPTPEDCELDVLVTSRSPSREPSLLGDEVCNYFSHIYVYVRKKKMYIAIGRLDHTPQWKQFKLLNTKN